MPDTTQAQSFAPPVQFLTGQGPQDSVVGDFNGDGRPDVATMNSGANSVSVLLNIGGGSFAPKVDYPVDDLMRAITVGDFDGDGKLDLATGNINLNQKNITVLFGNGDGTFRSGGSYATATTDVQAISSGDFNGDGKFDLATVGDGFVNVLLSKGDGTFSSATAYGVGASPDAIAVGDINNDGKVDLGVTELNNNGTNASLLLGKGDGTFQPAAFIALGTSSPARLRFVDLNGDGKLDALTTFNGNFVAIHLGNGDATFKPPVTYPIPNGFNLTLPAVADLNNDGKLDLVVSTQVEIATLLGNGDGTFRPAVNLQGIDLSQTVAAGDINSDGKVDLVATNSNSNKISVLLNQSGPHNISGVVTDDKASPLSGVTVTLSGAGVVSSSTLTALDGSYSFSGLTGGINYTVTPSKTNYSFAPPSQTFDNLSSSATANFTGTLLRFFIRGVITDVSGSAMSGVTVTLSGSSSAVTTTGADGSFTFASLPAGGNYTVTPSLPRFVFAPAARVFNNLSANRAANFIGSLQTFTISGTVKDTATSAVLSGLTVTLSGSKTATTTTGFDGTYSFPGLTVGGDYTVTVSPKPSDTLFQNYVLLLPLSRSFPNLSSNATSDFKATLLFSVITQDQRTGPADVVANDFNNDGKADLAVSYPFNQNVSLLLGNGDGTFQPGRQVAVNEGTPGMVTGDFDGDGKLDIALPNRTSDYLHNPIIIVLFGNGDGTFQSEAFALPPTNGPGFSSGRASTTITAGDFNRDGKLDLIEAGSTTNINGTTFSMNVLLNGGGRAFNLLPNAPLSALPQKARAVDFNGDGKPDLVFANDALTVSILSGNGDGTFSAPSNINLGGNPRWISVGDFNNDGKFDVAAHDESTGKVHVLLGNGDGTFTLSATFSAPGGALVAADFNADGKLDLAVLNATRAKVDTFIGNGNGTFNPGASNSVNQNSSNLVAGDFNGDGVPDLAVADSQTSSSNITVLLNTMSAPSLQFSTTIVNVGENVGFATITVTRSGDLSKPASVDYSTSNSTASERSDFTSAFGTLHFATGEDSKTFTVFITDDALVESSEELQLGLGNPIGASLGTNSTAKIVIADNDTAPPTPENNPVNQSEFFVRQHYRDFLNREPDQSGLSFWTNEIESCGADAVCREVKRIHVSAAFFLSIEFKETGYLVYRLHQASFNTGENLRLRTFLSDTQEISRGVVVGAPGWEQQLEQNKQSFLNEFVARPQFTIVYPQTMTAAQYVDALIANTSDPQNPNSGGTLSQAERNQLIADLSSGTKTRAQILRAIAENAEFQRRQSNKAFVLMQYFGYLRRNPNNAPDTNFDGYNFWLSKLNQFNGNFVNAEMVKAFITADEYRSRFGQP